jgi:hypothetical protein
MCPQRLCEKRDREQAGQQPEQPDDEAFDRFDRERCRERARERRSAGAKLPEQRQGSEQHKREGELT